MIVRTQRVYKQRSFDTLIRAPVSPAIVRRRALRHHHHHRTAAADRFCCIGTSAVGGATLANVNKNSLLICLITCVGGLANQMPFYYDGLFTKKYI